MLGQRVAALLEPPAASRATAFATVPLLLILAVLVAMIATIRPRNAAQADNEIPPHEVSLRLSADAFPGS